MIIEVKVTARAKTRDVRRDAAGHYRIRTTKAREGGKANDDVVDILSEHFGVPKSSIYIKSGHTSSRKIIEILA